MKIADHIDNFRLTETLRRLTAGSMVQALVIDSMRKLLRRAIKKNKSSVFAAHRYILYHLILPLAVKLHTFISTV